MPFDYRKLAKYQATMTRRLESLRSKTEHSLDFAVDNVMLDRVDTYFKVEEGFAEIDRTIELIREEVNQVDDLSGAVRLQSRLEYLEDRFEDLDSELRERPRRRRSKIDFTAFFRAAGGEGGDLPGARGEITNTQDALRALGLEHGSSMHVITRAFRRRAKELHPDVREGDRSSEPELRRIIEAYQYLKDNFAYSQTEPPIDR